MHGTDNGCRQFANVGIGYVTGANDFFHLDPGVAAALGIPGEFLRACVRRGRALAGLRFTDADWNGALARGDAGYLLHLPGAGRLPPAVARYVADVESGRPYDVQVQDAFALVRVPHVYMPDAFLTYMSGDLPRSVANDARVVAPNTLHVVRLHRGFGLTSEYALRDVADLAYQAQR